MKENPESKSHPLSRYAFENATTVRQYAARRSDKAVRNHCIEARRDFGVAVSACLGPEGAARFLDEIGCLVAQLLLDEHPQEAAYAEHRC